MPATRTPIVGALAAALLAACLLAACGSGGAGTTAGTAPTGRSTSSSAATGTATSGLKVIGTPNFAKPSPSEPVQSGIVHVEYRDITIHPDTLRVRAGTTVQWTNRDPVAHNVTSVSGPQRFATSNFGEGATVSVKLTRPGIVHYECTNHPATMNGTIEVLR